MLFGKTNVTHKRILSLFLLAGLLGAFLSGCGSTPASSTAPAPLPAPVISSAQSQKQSVALRREINFVELQQQNIDITAWIEVPGTVIDYPVLYSGDNMFYLNHDENRQQSTYGAVFMDMANLKNLTDPVVVLYGHYTPDESYFTQLHRYKDREYFDQNREMFLYFPGHQLEYEVVAAFTADNQSILYDKDYSQKADMEGFIQWMANAEAEGDHHALEDVTTNDRFLVLSTCVQQVGGDNRYLVVGRLVEEI